MARSHPVTVEMLDALVAAFNAHDVDRVMTFFHHDCTMDGPRGPSPHGRRWVGTDEVRAAVAERFAGLPDVHYGGVRHLVAGDRAVTEWTLTGTTPEGERIEVRGCDHLEFREGKVVRKDSFWKIVE
jgi:hypothetical protein